MRRQAVPVFLKHRRNTVQTQGLPNFIRRKAQNRRHQTHHRMGDVVQRTLCCTTRVRGFAAGVQTVFENIQIKATQVFRAEADKLLHCEVEFILVVISQNTALQLLG